MKKLNDNNKLLQSKETSRLSRELFNHNHNNNKMMEEMNWLLFWLEEEIWNKHSSFISHQRKDF